jgi:hypothetical protein
MAHRMHNLRRRRLRIDVISGHRKEGKIYDFMKLMLASDLAENNKNKKQ